MKVPLSKPYVDDEIRRGVIRALDSGRYILGPESTAFEAEYARSLGVSETVLVNSATAGIQLTLEALGVKPGDEVIVPSLTAFPTAEGVFRSGATPVFADIDDSFTMDPTHAASLVSPRTVGILPVHLYGHPADMDKLADLANKKKLFLLEDCAQAHGAKYKDKPVGSLAWAGIFSFYPSKNLTVAGDGGLIASSDAALLAKLRMLRDHGRKERYSHELVGMNSRFNDIQAAVGRVQLKHLGEFIEGRRKAAAAYDKQLRKHGMLTLPGEKDWASHAYHLYVLRMKDRDAMKDFLKEKDVASEIHYPIPCHLQPATLSRVKKASLPKTEEACAEILSLPMFPALTDEQISHVGASVEKFLEKHAARKA